MVNVLGAPVVWANASFVGSEAIPRPLEPGGRRARTSPAGRSPRIIGTPVTGRPLFCHNRLFRLAKVLSQIDEVRPAAKPAIGGRERLYGEFLPPPGRSAVALYCPVFPPIKSLNHWCVDGGREPTA